MMTSSNWNIFPITGTLCGEFAGHKGHWRGTLVFSLICAWINGSVDNREAGDLKLRRVHYDVIDWTSLLLSLLTKYNMWNICMNKTNCKIEIDIRFSAFGENLSPVKFIIISARPRDTCVATGPGNVLVPSRYLDQCWHIDEAKI